MHTDVCGLLAMRSHTAETIDHVISRCARLRSHTCTQISNMFSCEPRRTSAHSDDLRWRMVWQRDGLGCTYDGIARNLCVDKSTVKRIVDHFRLSGNVSKKPYPAQRCARKLILPAQLLILQLVMDHPAHYLDEIQKELKDILLIDVDISIICRFLQKCGFTRQKLCNVALQQDKFLRQQFITSYVTCLHTTLICSYSLMRLGLTTEMHSASMDTVYEVKL